MPVCQATDGATACRTVHCAQPAVGQKWILQQWIAQGWNPSASCTGLTRAFQALARVLQHSSREVHQRTLHEALLTMMASILVKAVVVGACCDSGNAQSSHRHPSSAGESPPPTRSLDSWTPATSLSQQAQHQETIEAASQHQGMAAAEQGSQPTQSQEPRQQGQTGTQSAGASPPQKMAPGDTRLNLACKM